MRRKRINHYADVVCRMFTGWRVGDDLETLATLPEGRIHINLLDGTAEHGEAGHLSLYIAGEIQAWLRKECKKDGIDYSAINTAALRVDIVTSRVAPERKKIVCFNLDVSSKLTTDEAEYTAHVSEFLTWHARREVLYRTSIVPRRYGKT